jgi:Ser-tRNA(Ala) deacylase AlaX
MTTIKKYLASDALSGKAAVTKLLDGGRTIRLVETLFHAQGGGQPCDTGVIAGITVVSVKHAPDGDVDHHLAEPVDLRPGDEVDFAVHEARRLTNARYHSAGHLIADAVADVWPGLKAVQGHHWPGEARVEFASDGVGPVPSLEEVQQAVDALIDKDPHFGITGDPYRERAIRIGDFAPVPCGGTHVKSGQELVGLKITKVKHRKGRLRLSYTI